MPGDRDFKYVQLGFRMVCQAVYAKNFLLPAADRLGWIGWIGGGSVPMGTSWRRSSRRAILSIALAIALVHKLLQAGKRAMNFPLAAHLATSSHLVILLIWPE